MTDDEKLQEIKRCIREFYDGYYDETVEKELLDYLDELVREAKGEA